MGKFQDRIADAVFERFNALPAKYKPAVRANGVSSWIPLSGIVVSNENDNTITCLAIGTGMKCLPAAKVPQAGGLVLHDWHAEVLAIRAFNRFLLDECLELAVCLNISSSVLRRREAREISNSKGLQPFTIRENLQIHMYCSEAPCGDASMELVMNTQQDATPWPLAVPVAVAEGDLQSLPGREYFSELGIVRRKPSRADSPPTLSKSCSDKIALKQCTSLLSSLTSLLVSPSNAYLESLILPLSQYNRAACDRAFGTAGRMKPVSGRTWNAGYEFHAFHVVTTVEEFAFSRRRASSPVAGSNLSAVCTPNLQESLINGVLEGRKQTDPRGGSALCDAHLWRVASNAMGSIKTPMLQNILQLSTYRRIKDSEAFEDRRQVKEQTKTEALSGWIRNVEDDFEVQPGS